MKIVKKILIIIAIIIAIPLVVALFAPKGFYSERQIVIEKPKSQVFEYIRFVRNQDNYGVWQLSDPDLKYSEEGIDGTVGYKYSWDSKKLGKGSQKIISISSPDSISTELDFGMGMPANSFFVLQEQGPDQTRVTWGMKGVTPYPWNVFNLLFDVGKDFEQGLQNLKELLESQELTEQAAALQYFLQTQDNLRQEVRGLTKAQLDFQPSADQWSISQCLEHIILTEQMIFDMIRENMKQPANPEKRAEIAFSDEDIVRMATDRSEKYKAPDILVPAGKYQDAASALKDMEAQRAVMHDFIRNTPVEELRNHISASPSGLSDAYQSLMFLAGHTARHTLQIQEIKAAPGFPDPLNQ